MENCEAHDDFFSSLDDRIDVPKETYKFQSNLDFLISPESSKMKNQVNIPKSVQNEIASKEKIQKKWISMVQKKYKNKFTSNILERFSKNYPSISELAEEVGCSIQNVENALKGINEYIKWVEIHDLHDPINYLQRYFGWKNEKLRQNF